MPDDLSHLGYCASCHAIHERDEDGYVCSDTRPLPVAKTPRSGFWQRLRSRLRRKRG